MDIVDPFFCFYEGKELLLASYNGLMRYWETGDEDISSKLFDMWYLLPKKCNPINNGVLNAGLYFGFNDKIVKFYKNNNVWYYYVPYLAVLGLYIADEVYDLYEGLIRALSHGFDYYNTLFMAGRLSNTAIHLMQITTLPY